MKKTLPQKKLLTAQTITTQGRFKGTNSLGYIKGRFYKLSITINPKLSFIYGLKYPIEIVRLDRNELPVEGSHCPYSNEKSFLENWELI